MVTYDVISAEQVKADRFYINIQKDLLVVAMTCTTLSYKARDADLTGIVNKIVLIWI